MSKIKILTWKQIFKILGYDDKFFGEFWPVDELGFNNKQSKIITDEYRKLVKNAKITDIDQKNFAGSDNPEDYRHISIKTHNYEEERMLQSVIEYTHKNHP